MYHSATHISNNFCYIRFNIIKFNIKKVKFIVLRSYDVWREKLKNLYQHILGVIFF